MQEIDALIDNQTDLSLEMVELDIRNKQAYNELQSFNDNSTFLFIHPLTTARQFALNQLSDLTKLKTDNPDLFLNEITNIIQNIRRIESQIRLKKYKSEEELNAWKENLLRAKLRHEVIKQILSS